MASIQPKMSHGHKYWYIVESRRVNGKPRPVVLAYLGKPEDLLRRLQGIGGNLKIKSYSHGGVAAMLEIAHKLNVPSIINKYIESSRAYTAKKPTRNNLTAGITLLLGAIGRVCMPTSKRGWWDWAKNTSCEYLLRCSLSRVDSQHFWDLMDALPVGAVEKIEDELLLRVREYYSIDADTLFFDTTNFYTYIATTNDRCDIARRGKNKQKRGDLRQVGLAMVVTRRDYIPLFHLTYRGNRSDCKIFAEVIGKINNRLKALGLDIEKHTLVFDRGNNSKINLKLVSDSKIHYVAALSPYQHRALLDDALGNFKKIEIDGEAISVYRDKREIWGEQRTVAVFVSERLKAGRLRGIYQGLERRVEKLNKIKQTLAENKVYKDKNKLEKKIAGIVKGQFVGDIIDWSLTENSKKHLQFDFSINDAKLAALEEEVGLRILITDRHEWDTNSIIKTYNGQAYIEQAFKNIKNPHHLALKPQFHWTDQKIVIHYFLCILGYLLAAIAWRQAKEKSRFKGSLDTLLDDLNNVRLSAILEQNQERGKPKIIYQLEETSDYEKSLLEALDIAQSHVKRPKFTGVGVYN